DNCGPQALPCERSDAAGLGEAYPVGCTQIVWTVTDIHGNATSCTQEVCVEDNEKPTIDCPDDVTTDSNPGLCSAVVDAGTPGTDDNCGTSSLAGVRSDGLSLAEANPVGGTQ